MKLIYVIMYSLLFLACSDNTGQTSISKIAHAGGGFNGETYTDSIDALNFNKIDTLFLKLIFLSLVIMNLFVFTIGVNMVV